MFPSVLRVAFAAAAILASALPGYAAKRLALVIGNGGYVHEPALANPLNDEADVAAALQSLGFRVFEGRNLDKLAMDAKLREFIEAAEGAEVALLFYAGHGLQIEGRNYLVPVDAALERRTSVGFELIEVDRLAEQMEASASVSILFLDACRDNPLASRLSGRIGRSAYVARGLSPAQTAGAGVLLAFATAPGKVAKDGDGRNSPFTAALLRHIRAPGLEVKALMTRVRSEVAELTHGDQIPWDTESLRDEVYLAGLPPKPEPTRPSVSASPPPTPCESAVDLHASASAVMASDPDAGLRACARAVAEYPDEPRFVALMQAAEEQRAFRNAMKAVGKDPAEAYLVLYPTGSYAADVRRRLAPQLAPGPPPSAAAAPSPEPKPSTTATPRPATSAAASPTPRPSARPAQGDIAGALNLELIRLGCYQGPPPSTWSAASIQAMQRFERQAGLRVTLGEPELDTLATALAKPAGFCRPPPAAPTPTPTPTQVARPKPPPPAPPRVAPHPAVVAKARRPAAAVADEGDDPAPKARRPPPASAPPRPEPQRGGCFEVGGQQYCN